MTLLFLKARAAFPALGTREKQQHMLTIMKLNFPLGNQWRIANNEEILQQVHLYRHLGTG